MSLETEIKNLTAAVVALTAKLESSNVAPAAPVAQVAAPVAAFKPGIASAGPDTIPAPTPVAPQAPQMPAMPTFAAAPAPVAPAALPFNDGPSLIQYVMGVYKEIGAAKGANIQAVLSGLGYQNINDVKPEHYAALYQGVEALKA